MKESPQNLKLEELLRSSRLAAGGFMGEDTRSVFEVIDDDAAALYRLGFTPQQLADRMREITAIATAALGMWVQVGDRLKARVDEVKGALTCPWPHPGQFAKRVTHLKIIETGRTAAWSDLNIHLIAEHGFFEGKGSTFRIDPKELSAMIFTPAPPADSPED